MSAKQVQEWETFAAIEPFPEDKIVNALAYIAHIFANGTLQKKDKSKWSMDDFLIKYFRTPQKKVKAQPISEMKKMVMAIAEAFGGKKKKEKVKRDPYKIKYEAEKYIPRRTTPPVNPVGKRKK